MCSFFNLHCSFRIIQALNSKVCRSNSYFSRLYMVSNDFFCSGNKQAFWWLNGYGPGVPKSLMVSFQLNPLIHCGRHLLPLLLYSISGAVTTTTTAAAAAFVAVRITHSLHELKSMCSHWMVFGTHN